jgi:hypothetical protein
MKALLAFYGFQMFQRFQSFKPFKAYAEKARETKFPMRCIDILKRRNLSAGQGIPG